MTNNASWSRVNRAESPAGKVPEIGLVKSITRIDLLLLVSALFLQRFYLPFLQGTAISLDIVGAVLIVGYQFAAGRLLIQYDRLLWFIFVVLATVPTLVLNLGDMRLTSYGLFLVLYFMFTFTHSSADNQYESTLQSFQSVVLVLSCLAIAQFFAQFVVDGAQLIMFFGIFPDTLLPVPDSMGGIGGWNTISKMYIGGSSLIRSNGIFLVEPATMAQMAALAIVIEVLEFRRPRYLIPLTLGLLLAYSGTGISIVLLSLPLAVLVNRRAQLPALLITLFAFGLFATGIVDLATFTSRTGEFDDTHASGFVRFISPLWMATDYLRTGSVTELLFGKGPGYGYFRAAFYATSANTWFKVFLEYGLAGGLVFASFLASCFRKSRCPMPVIAGLLYHYLFTENNLLTPSVLIVMAVLVTLSGPEPRRARIDDAGRYRSYLAAGSATH
jgi:hypothetical protein